MRMEIRCRDLLCGAAMALSVVVGQAQKPTPVGVELNEPTIAGRAVILDAEGKLLPFPMGDNTGYSYSGYFESQWTILWDQYNRQRLPLLLLLF